MSRHDAGRVQIGSRSTLLGSRANLIGPGSTEPRFGALRDPLLRRIDAYTFEAPPEFGRTHLTRDDVFWARGVLSKLDPIGTGFGADYCERYRKHDPYKANEWLRRLGELVDEARRRHLPASSYAIDRYARRLAQQFQRLLADPSRNGQHAAIVQMGSEICTALGARKPDGQTATSTLRRLTDQHWWKRRLRRACAQSVDQIHRAAGRVSAARQRYVSDDAHRFARQRIGETRQLLEMLQAINEQGDSFTLAELAEHSIANPANRRAEMMVRLRGTEEACLDLGMEGLFITMTCPSRFHPAPRRGDLNPAYDGSTAKDAHEHLKAVFAKVRASLHRRGIRIIGMRVVEPHFDGTPHWHLVAFFSPDEIQTVKQVFHTYALAESPDEPGASEHRLNVKDIEQSKGGAIAYIAKYITKSIDGYGLGSDRDGGDPEQAVQRVDSWRKTYGIRAFQFFGTPDVSTWRELRRIELGSTAAIEACREAADRGCWKDYIAAQGGLTPEDHQQVRPLYGIRVSATTGECSPPLNRYGEPAALRVVGVADVDGHEQITRNQIWRVEFAKPATEESSSGSAPSDASHRARSAPLDPCQ